MLQCRKHADLFEWCDVLHRVVERSRTLIELSRRYQGQGSTTKQTAERKSKTAAKVLRCCRAIAEDVGRIRRLDRAPLLAAQARSERRRATLGGLCGMDAAVHVGAWLVRGLGDVAVSANPKPLRWTARASARDVDFGRLRGRQQAITQWVVSSLTARTLDSVYSGLRSDLAWLCRRRAPSAGSVGAIASDSTTRTQNALDSYEQECARLFASTDPEIQAAVKRVFNSERHIKGEYCAVLEAMSERGHMTQKLIAQHISTRGVSVKPTQVGHRLRAMATFKAVSGERQYRRGPLGTLLMKNCPDRA